MRLNYVALSKHYPVLYRHKYRIRLVRRLDWKRNTRSFHQDSMKGIPLKNLYRCERKRVYLPNCRLD